MVQYVKSLIQNSGLNKTVNYMRNNRDIFTTSKGEYVFIYSYDEKNKQFYYIYHHYDVLDKKNQIDAQNALNKTCPEEFCPLAKILKELTSFADKNTGFFEHKWFNPKTKDIIVKRTYVNTIKNIKTKIKKKATIYIGSGATIESKESEIDVINTLISAFITILFLILWKYLNIDELFKTSITNIIFYTVLIVNLYNLFNSNFELRAIDKIEDEHNTITQTSISLAGLGLALAFFFSEVLHNKDKNVIKNSIKLLSLSIVFSLLSFIKLKNKINSKNLSRKVEIKNGFLLNSVIFIIISLIYVYSQF
jgi:hypothetical protein